MAEVSIILPVYCTTEQSLQWLDECVASAVSQEMCEVVVWDDGSTVDISPIMDKHMLDWYGTDVNNGVSFARNQAVERASAPLMFPLDCDDVLADGAVAELLSHWDDGIPVYPDIYKFGDENEAHYQLLDYSLDHAKTKVGISSVGVLHSKGQWEIIGGWDEHLDFYEDGHYNSKLFIKFCAVHVKLPLYGYRIHKGQRSVVNKHRSAQMARKVLSMVQEFERSLDMPCPGCGKRRTPSSSPAAASVQTAVQRNSPGKTFAQRVTELPGATGPGLVHATYVGGKGRGRHYYRGPHTRFAYKVKHGDIVVNVDIRDTASVNDMSPASLFIRIEGTQGVEETLPPPPPKPTPASVPDEPHPQPVTREPVVPVERAPVVEDVVDELPDISKVPYRELITLDLSSEDAAKLLAMERDGRARKKHIMYLKKRVASESE